jgi:hypothetical protein
MYTARHIECLPRNADLQDVELERSRIFVANFATGECLPFVHRGFAQ